MTTSSNTTPATRRQVLAFLALADAPVPDEIKFDCYGPREFRIEVGSLAAGAAWTIEFGGLLWPDSHILHVPASEKFPARLVVNHEVTGWRGWTVHLGITEWHERGGSTDLDADTREQLAAVAAGGTP